MSVSKRAQRKTTGQWLIPVIFGLVYVCILGVFAVQTYFLVDWLFPEQNYFMKIVTVFSFDGVALLCALAEAFYSFRSRGSHQMTRVAWGIAFVGSCVCTGVWMILSASTKMDFPVPDWVVNVSYIVVTLVFVLVIVLATFAAMGEWRATHPLLGYDGEGEDENLSDTPALPAPSNKFDDMLNTGPMLPAVNGNGQIKKKVAQGGATQTTP